MEKKDFPLWTESALFVVFITLFTLVAPRLPDTLGTLGALIALTAFTLGGLFGLFHDDNPHKELFVLLLIPALSLSFVLKSAVPFIGASIIIGVYLLTVKKIYAFLPALIILVLIGFTMHELKYPHTENADYLLYIHKVAKGVPYSEISDFSYDSKPHPDSLKVGYNLPFYFTPPKFFASITRLELNRSAQVLNFIYATIAVLFLLLLLRTPLLSNISDNKKLAGMLILFSAASFTRVYSFIRPESLQLTLIIISIYLFAYANEKIYSWPSIFALFFAAAAMLVRALAFVYLVSALAYFILKSFSLRKHRVKIICIALLSVLFVVLVNTHYNHNPFQIKVPEKKYSYTNFKPTELFTMKAPIFADKEGNKNKSYIQTMIHDWWGHYQRRNWKKYNNPTLWKSHIILSYIATLFIIGTIASCFFTLWKQRRLKKIQFEHMIALHLVLLIGALFYLLVKYSKPAGIDILNMLYYIQVFPPIYFLFIKGLGNLEIKDTYLLTASLFFFTTSIYTHLLG